MLQMYVNMPQHLEAVEHVKEEEKDQILREIEEIEKTRTAQDRELTSKMTAYFDDHYRKMKDEIGLNENFGF